MAPTTFLSLPNELLLQLPAHMHSIEDFTNLSCTNRRLRSILTSTPPRTILQLAARAAPTFFSPHPSFLALSIARQLSSWVLAPTSASDRDSRTKRLVRAFQQGIRGILDFALEDDVDVGLGMARIRSMHRLRFSVINPLNDTIDAMVGKEWYRQPNFWNGGVEDAFTLHCDVDDATMQFLLYGELFGSSMDSYLKPEDDLPSFGVGTRIEFVKYCIPDWIDAPKQHGRSDGFEVLASGPYAEGSEEKVNGNQTALAHLLGGAMFDGTLWNRAWARVLREAGGLDPAEPGWPADWRTRIAEMQMIPLEEAEADARDARAEAEQESGEGWRFRLFVAALTQVGGLDTMEMVAQFKGREVGKDCVMKPEWKAKIEELRDLALALSDEDKPGYETFGQRRELRISKAPELPSECYWCCCGMWGGM